MSFSATTGARSEGVLKVAERPVASSGHEHRGRLRSVSTSAWATLAVVGLTAAALIALAILTVVRDYRATFDRAELTVEQAARTAAEYYRWIVESGLVVLDRVDSLIGATPTIFLRTEIGEIDRAIAALPGDPTVWVADRTGRVVLSTDRDSAPVGVAAQALFDAEQPDARWAIARFAGAGGTTSLGLTVVRRIDRDGEFQGIAGIRIPPAQLETFAESLSLGEEATLGLVRTDGWLVARYPGIDEAVDLSSRPLFTEYLPEADSGSYIGTSSITGRDAIIGYATVPNLPLVAAATVPVSTALGLFWQRSRLLILLGTPIMLGLLVLAGWVAMLVTKEQRRQFALQQALERNEALLADIHHRVKNNLQLVTSLIGLQPGPEENKRELIRRVSAVSTLHHRLYLNNDTGAIRLDEYLREAIEALEASYESDASVSLELDQIEVDMSAALPIALIATEVASNALRHAFDGRKDGRIAIRLTREGDQITLVVEDNGKGMENMPEGFGMRLIESIASQLGAHYAFDAAKEREGTRFVLTIPVPRVH